MIKLGEMSYINCMPLYYYLKSLNKYSFIKGSPKELNSLMFKNEILSAPASFFEYSANPDKYDILPFGISAFMEVQSVQLFSQEPVEFLDEKEIYLTGESASSSNLLKIIIAKYMNIKPIYKVLEPLEPHYNLPAKLLIGDTALYEYNSNLNSKKYSYTYDLSNIWGNLTGLPTVFGVWLVQKSTDTEALKELINDLVDFTTEFDYKSKYNEIWESNNMDKQSLPKETIFKYWDLIDFSIESAHLASMVQYNSDLCDFKLIQKSPKISMFDRDCKLIEL